MSAAMPSERPIQSSCSDTSGSSTRPDALHHEVLRQPAHEQDREAHQQPHDGQQDLVAAAPVHGQRQVDEREHAEEHEQGARVADRRSLGLRRGEADPADGEDDGDEDEQARLSATPARASPRPERPSPGRSSGVRRHRMPVIGRSGGRAGGARGRPRARRPRPSAMAPGAAARRGASRWCCRGPRRTSSGHGT